MQLAAHACPSLDMVQEPRLHRRMQYAHNAHNAHKCNAQFLNEGLLMSCRVPLRPCRAHWASKEPYSLVQWRRYSGVRLKHP
jgi:hypothetical protein